MNNFQDYLRSNNNVNSSRLDTSTLQEPHYNKSINSQNFGQPQLPQGNNNIPPNNLFPPQTSGINNNNMPSNPSFMPDMNTVGMMNGGAANPFNDFMASMMKMFMMSGGSMPTPNQMNFPQIPQVDAINAPGNSNIPNSLFRGGQTQGPLMGNSQQIQQQSNLFQSHVLSQGKNVPSEGGMVGSHRFNHEPLQGQSGFVPRVLEDQLNSQVSDLNNFYQSQNMFGNNRNNNFNNLANTSNNNNSNSRIGSNNPNIMKNKKYSPHNEDYIENMNPNLEKSLASDTRLLPFRSDFIQVAEGKPEEKEPLSSGWAAQNPHINKHANEFINSSYLQSSNHFPNQQFQGVISEQRPINQNFSQPINDENGKFPQNNNKLMTDEETMALLDDYPNLKNNSDFTTKGKENNGNSNYNNQNQNMQSRPNYDELELSQRNRFNDDNNYDNNSNFLQKNLPNNNKGFDQDRPIKPSSSQNLYNNIPTNSFDEKPIKSSQNNFDQENYNMDSNDKGFKNYNYNNNINNIPNKQDTWNYNESAPTNKFDEIPLQGVTKNFEELLQEKLQNNDSDYASNQENYNMQESGVMGGNNQKQNFLKKGTRSFLSNAQQRSKAAENHINTILEQEEIKANAIAANQKIAKSKLTFSPPNQQNSIKSEKRDVSVNFDSRPATSSGSGTSSNPSAPQQFLTQGAGKGGGLQGQAALQTQKANEQIQNDKKEKEPPNQLNFNKSSPKPSQNQEHKFSTLEEETQSNSSHQPNKKYEPLDYMKGSPFRGSRFDEVEQEANIALKKFSSNPSKNSDEKHRVEDTLQFDDQESWSSEKQKQKSVFGSPERDEEQKQQSDQKYQSQIVQKYFNKQPVNNQIQANNNKQVGPLILSKEQQQEIVQQYVAEQIEQLNREISKFKLENERVKNMRTKYEDNLKTVNKQKEEMAKKQQIETQEFQEWKEEERQKIRYEQKQAEKSLKVLQAQPNRQEREEIEFLKTELQKLKKETKEKDQRNQLTIDKLKKMNEELLSQNQEMTEEIQHLEKLRLSMGGQNLSSVNLSTNSSAHPQDFQQQRPNTGFSSSSSSQTTNVSNNLSAKQNSDHKNAPVTKNKSLLEESRLQAKHLKSIKNQANSDEELEEEDTIFNQNQTNPQQKQLSFADPKQNSVYNYHEEDDEENETGGQGHRQPFGQKYSRQQSDTDNHYKNENEDDDEGENQYENRNSEEDEDNDNDVENDHQPEYEDAENEDGTEDNEAENLESYDDIINFRPGGNQKSAGASNHNANHQNKFGKGLSEQSKFINSEPELKQAKIGFSNSNTNASSSILEPPGVKNLSNLVGNQVNSKREEPTPKNFKYNITTLSSFVDKIGIKDINQIISEDEFCYDQNQFFINYKMQQSVPQQMIGQNIGNDGKIMRDYADGQKEIIFHNGVKREIFPSNYIIVHFVNHDIKQQLPDKTLIYYFADAQTTQTTLPSGINIFRFHTQQIEMHFPDGSKEIKFHDGTEKVIFKSNEQQTMFPDGTVQKILPNKTKIILHPSGLKDIIYPDGVKEKMQ